MKNNWIEVKQSWFNRICAALFGKKICYEEDGNYIIMRYWKGVYYVVWSSLYQS